MFRWFSCVVMNLRWLPKFPRCPCLATVPCRDVSNYPCNYPTPSPAPPSCCGSGHFPVDKGLCDAPAPPAGDEAVGPGKGRGDDRTVTQAQGLCQQQARTITNPRDAAPQVPVSQGQTQSQSDGLTPRQCRGTGVRSGPRPPSTCPPPKWLFTSETCGQGDTGMARPFL